MELCICPSEKDYVPSSENYILCLQMGTKNKVAPAEQEKENEGEDEKDGEEREEDGERKLEEQEERYDASGRKLPL